MRKSRNTMFCCLNEQERTMEQKIVLGSKDCKCWIIDLTLVTAKVKPPNRPSNIIKSALVIWRG